MTGHIDTFAADNLPPKEEWPELDCSMLGYPDTFNVAVELLDKGIAQFGANRVLFHTDDGRITYGEFLTMVNQYAAVLVDELGVQPGNRILLRGPNTPELAALWFATLKAGGICVTTMPLLREVELSYIVTKAEVDVALCDARFADEIVKTQSSTPRLTKVGYFLGESPNDNGLTLDSLRTSKSEAFDAILTSANDTALIGFTSGTTGNPKATMHFHRDVLAICDLFPKHVLKPTKDDVFCGTPPFAFTFGLGALLLFPMRVGASAFLVEKPDLDTFLRKIESHKATVSFTSPTAYRAMLDKVNEYDISSLSKCVSAGETLPLPTFESWREKMGISIIDGIGATELLHIFISSAGDDIRPGATGKPVPGYQAKIVNDAFEELPKGQVGLLAVKGPTGCRYLDDDRQQKYVKNGWNLTGDAYKEDEDGYFWFQARADDMIISSGYNISGIEVERALLSHPSVAECGVVGVPDDARGHIVKAFIVLRDEYNPGDDLAKELQDFVKSEIAPYKYPRAIEFRSELPKTETGKLQRFKLRGD